MAVSTLAGRPGQINGSGDTTTALLKVFAGEVIMAFEESNLFLGLTEVKNVAGKAITWSWPVVGHGSVSYHTPGANILTDNDGAGRPYLKSIKTAERKIHMDRKLVEPLFFDELDQKLVHWDWRQKLASTIGQDLARTIDSNIFRLLWACGTGNGGATVSGGFAAGGTFGSAKIDVGAFSALTPAALVKALWDAKITMDKKFVPRQGRYAVMAPEVMQRFFFTESGTPTIAGLQWVDADYNGGTNGMGFRDGKVPMIAGFQLYEHVNTDFGASAAAYGPYDLSAGLGGTGGTGTDPNLYYNGLATTNESVTSNNDYSVTYSATNSPIVLAFQREAAATLKLENISIQSEYLIEYQGDVTVARMVLGHGILRPECIVAIGDHS